MARQNKKSRVVKFYTNGKLADDRYALFERVGQIVRRSDIATKRAVASTARRIMPIAREEVRQVFNVRPSVLNKRFRVEVTGASIFLHATSYRPPLIAFGGKWDGPSSAGATAEVEIGRRETYPGAFIAPGRIAGKNQKVIYQRKRGQKRVQKYGRYKGKLREPIRVLRGPSAYEMATGFIDGLGSLRFGGRNVTPPAVTILARVTEYHITELRRLFAVEMSHGR